MDNRSVIVSQRCLDIAAGRIRPEAHELRSPSAPRRTDPLTEARANGTPCRRCGAGPVRKYTTAPEGRGLAFYCADCRPIWIDPDRSVPVPVLERMLSLAGE